MSTQSSAIGQGTAVTPLREGYGFMSSLKTESKNKMATRDGFGRALEALGDKYPFVVLCADLADSVRVGYFMEKYPDRYIECGIAEANMMSIAAGIATTGMPAFATTFAMFAAGRAYEQIRNSIAYPHLNVKIGATHAGLSVGEDGATHQCLEDLALMRVLPGMTVFSPCDGVETKLATEAALRIDGPVYIRMGRSAVDVITDENEQFVPGKAVVKAEGADAVIFATGIMVGESLKARELLAARGYDVAVVNIHTIKPIDEETIVRYAEKTGRVFTVEEHLIIGGLGSAVAEVLGERCPTGMTRIGVNDTFGRSGTFEALLDHYGLDAAHIAARVENELKKA